MGKTFYGRMMDETYEKTLLRMAGFAGLQGVAR
jgi:hypothetical protein